MIVSESCACKRTSYCVAVKVLCLSEQFQIFSTHVQIIIDSTGTEARQIFFRKLVKSKIFQRVVYTPT